jgi:hypothetical protein
VKRKTQDNLTHKRENSTTQQNTTQNTKNALQ